jgi:hypothetical protein
MGLGLQFAEMVEALALVLRELEDLLVAQA